VVSEFDTMCILRFIQLTVGRVSTGPGACVELPSWIRVDSQPLAERSSSKDNKCSSCQRFQLPQYFRPSGTSRFAKLSSFLPIVAFLTPFSNTSGFVTSQPGPRVYLTSLAQEASALHPTLADLQKVLNLPSSVPEVERCLVSRYHRHSALG
jgi:hypothetical protein